MTRISVELIPRDAETLLRDAAEVRDCFPVADTLNVPDLMRFALRSWDTVPMLRPVLPRVVPHVRAIDIDPDGPLPGLDPDGPSEILVVRGDPPSDISRRTFPNSSESVIRRYRREAPHLTVYAAFDPYRRAPYRELEAVARKKDAGAMGFFTQPVFDRRMLDVCMGWLAGETVFWGLSPVIGPKSRSYWETTNHVVFPRDFASTIDANVAFACDAIRTVRAQGGHVYLMPLRVKLSRYLAPIQDGIA
ncbi:methylenetetrahydrofolate reductase [Gluconacetobacter tumulisoli]|uniref:Methylenetetrahydrofolate reductase n=1 Tax=Gluconacetobacter tumulisoli TaxID=1286189 RepID=A0A7W4K7N0_9PROT|nr:methylenetetrahydrofolate reductase [Gluconacetobacter tumulisoli]MBB2201868.1 methylenetetrahydrofolate reductase [Gluconacetobacter tumulisoli]